MRSAVVIPVYNQERFLSRCLDSLSAQTCRDFVAIAVDDGSTDSSAEILSRRAEDGDMDLRVVSRENGGVSAARNTGVEVALGMSDVDSVMFLDPDDRYAPRCVELARRAHAANSSAVVEWAFASATGAVSAFSSPERLEPSVWSKLYPRKVIEGIRFCEESNVAEDLAFNLEVEYRRRPRVVRITEPLYFYEENVASTMHRPLGAQDFERRRAIIRHIVAVLSDDPAALDAVCRDEVPELLKQFWRDLRRVRPEESSAAREAFGATVRELRTRGLLHPKRGRFKDLKYYLRFLFVSGWMLR